MVVTLSNELNVTVLLKLSTFHSLDFMLCLKEASWEGCKAEKMLENNAVLRLVFT